MNPLRTIILGAAGRDFHNFNVYFKDNNLYKILAFTAEQIPDIAGRIYPASLSGKKYPRGIPIYSENKLVDLIKKLKIDVCILSYSDLSNQEVMMKAAIVQSAGADFSLLGPKSTQLKSKKKVISICAVRTGSGKSQITDYIGDILDTKKIKYTVVRHPMPYGNLKKQKVQIFKSYDDLNIHNTTIEEREEYEPHLAKSRIVLAGIDYKEILKEAEKRSQIILWDGGNNDLPFFKSDLHIVLVDPLRQNHELLFYPGLTNLIMADIVIINKENSANKKQIENSIKNIRKVNSKAKIIHTDSIIQLDSKVKANSKAIVIEDGPTTTHGGMNYGAGWIAAKKLRLKIIQPQKFAVGSLKKLYNKYSNLKEILPAMGYSAKQISELKKTIHNSKPEIVIIGTPIDLSRFLKLKIPSARAIYKIKDETSTLKKEILKFLK